MLYRFHKKSRVDSHFPLYVSHKIMKQFSSISQQWPVECVCVLCLVSLCPHRFYLWHIFCLLVLILSFLWPLPILFGFLPFFKDCSSLMMSLLSDLPGSCLYTEYWRSCKQRPLSLMGQEIRVSSLKEQEEAPSEPNEYIFCSLKQRKGF